MTPAGTSNELDVQNGWEENTHTHTHTHTHTPKPGFGGRGHDLSSVVVASYNNRTCLLVFALKFRTIEEGLFLAGAGRGSPLFVSLFCSS